jgi:hypothetical protein
MPWKPELRSVGISSLNNSTRPHQDLGYQTSAQEYASGPVAVIKERILISGKQYPSIYTSGRIAESLLNLE